MEPVYVRPLSYILTDASDEQGSLYCPGPGVSVTVCSKLWRPFIVILALKSIEVGILYLSGDTEWI